MVYLVEVIFSGFGSSCFSSCSSMILMVAFVSAMAISLSPSEVMMSFILMSVMVAFTPCLVFSVMLTISSGSVLPTFLMATNSPVA